MDRPQLFIVHVWAGPPFRASARAVEREETLQFVDANRLLEFISRDVRSATGEGGSPTPDSGTQETLT